MIRVVRALRLVRAPRSFVLVACSGPKLSYATHAAALYQSTLFRRSMVYAERFGHGWAILSARHGLVLPWQHVRPYQHKLTAAEAPAWARAVASATTFQILTPDIEIEILAGALYSKHLRPLLEDRGHTVREPLAGLQIGERLRFLNTILERTDT